MAAERLEQALGEEHACFIEGCPRDWEQPPSPDGPLTVGVDGGFARAPRKQGHFEVMAGKSMLAFRRDQEEDEEEPTGKCFALVQTFDEKPKRRLFERLKRQGMQENQQVVFFSDGGQDVRNLQFYLHPQAEHLLDTVPCHPAADRADANCQGSARGGLRRQRAARAASSRAADPGEHRVVSLAWQRIPGSPTSELPGAGPGRSGIREPRRDHAQTAQSAGRVWDLR